jgi:glycolate oxidase FAD binding subunit
MSAFLPVSALPDGVVDYPARDMTITVGAGMIFGRLQAILKAEQQQLPIDVHDDGLTLSECVAFDHQGPRQFGYGTLRDYVIGIEAMDGNGRVFHAGGRVVKNVAGYDLCRLLTGSRNLLGQIQQLTFKLKPIPDERRLFIAGFRTLQDLQPALDRLNLTRSTPVILDVVTRPALHRFPPLQQSLPQFPDYAAPECLLIAGVEGTEQSCSWQLRTLSDELNGTATEVWTPTDMGLSEAYCRAGQLAARPETSDEWFLKSTLLPSRLTAALTALSSHDCEMFARAGNGLLFIRHVRSGMNVESDLETRIIDRLRSLTEDHAGYIEVLKGNEQSSMPSRAVQDLTLRLQKALGTSEDVTKD